MRKANSSHLLSAVGALATGPNVDSTVVFSDYPTRALAGNLIKVPLLLGITDHEQGLFRAQTNLTVADWIWDYYQLELSQCPDAIRANYSIYNDIPTWRYRWFGVFPNTNLTTYPDSGAYHGSEVPVLFNSVATGPDVPPNTAAELAIMDYLRGAWAAFAKDPVGGLTTYEDGWPMYDPFADTLIRLAYNDTTGTNLADPLLYDAACADTFAA